MSLKLRRGSFAEIIEGKEKKDKGGNAIRTFPAVAKDNTNVKVWVPLGDADVLILDRPSGWPKKYPYKRGGYTWVYVQRHNIIGWMAAARRIDDTSNVPYLRNKAPKLIKETKKWLGLD